jgi:hypothetical protein
LFGICCGEAAGHPSECYRPALKMLDRLLQFGNNRCFPAEKFGEIVAFCVRMVDINATNAADATFGNRRV